MRGVGELGMSEVYNFIEDLINEDKILADGFFIDDTAEVFDDDDDAVEKLQYIGWGHVEAGGGYDVDGGFFKVGEIDAFYVEDGFDVTLRQLDLAIEELGGVLDEVGAEVSVDYGVAAS